MLHKVPFSVGRKFLYLSLSRNY